MTFFNVLAIVADFVTIVCGIQVAINSIRKLVKYIRNHKN